MYCVRPFLLPFARSTGRPGFEEGKNKAEAMDPRIDAPPCCLCVILVEGPLLGIVNDTLAYSSLSARARAHLLPAGLDRFRRPAHHRPPFPKNLLDLRLAFPFLSPGDHLMVSSHD